MQPNTRKKTYVIVLVGLGCLVVLGLAIGLPLGIRGKSYSKKANELLDKYPLIDG